MKIREAIKNLIESKDVSYADIAKKLGVSRQSTWNSLNGVKTNSISVEKVVKIGEVAGYRMMLVPDDVNKPTGAIEITGG